MRDEEEGDCGGKGNEEVFGALFEVGGDAAVGDDSKDGVGFSGRYGFESKSLVASRIWFNVQSEN